MDPCSAAAYADTKPRMTRDRQRILELLRLERVAGNVTNYFVTNDLTCDEIEMALGMSHATCSARLADMRREGLVERTGLRRKTRSGSAAHVLRAVR